LNMNLSIPENSEFGGISYIRSFWSEVNALRVKRASEKRSHATYLNNYRCLIQPVYGVETILACTMDVFISQAMDVHCRRLNSRCNLSQALKEMIQDSATRINKLMPLVCRLICYVPKARTKPVELVRFGSLNSTSEVAKERLHSCVREMGEPLLKNYYEAYKRTQLFFPDKRLIQFDCGKLQELDILLRKLKKGGHRCLIFSQMSSMLNILEIFLNIHG